MDVSEGASTGSYEMIKPQAAPSVVKTYLANSPFVPRAIPLGPKPTAQVTEHTPGVDDMNKGVALCMEMSEIELQLACAKENLST